MRMYLQFGYGMMDLSGQLIENWHGGTVVLSPRDLKPDQLVRFSGEVRGKANGRVLFDPQFYVPHADHERLCSHDFWPADYDTSSFWSGTGLGELVEKVFACNQTYGCREVILPGMLAPEIDDDWLAAQQAVLDAAEGLESDLPVLCTIALSPDAAKDADQIALLLEHVEDWEPSGYYLVCQHPPGDYFVTDQDWLNNVLGLAASLRLRDAKVIFGYSNQQMLIAATAKAHAICSGTWQNVRAFSPDKFIDTDEIRRKSTWYYCPQALSEYKIPALDIAQQENLLQRMALPAQLDGGYATTLFSGAQPSSVNWSESDSFRHYLHALRAQARQSERDTFNETIDRHNRWLDTAEALLARLSQAGISGEVRDFASAIEVNRNAIQSLVSSQGPMLRRRWANL